MAQLYNHPATHVFLSNNALSLDELIELLDALETYNVSEIFIFGFRTKSKLSISRCDVMYFFQFIDSGKGYVNPSSNIGMDHCVC